MRDISRRRTRFLLRWLARLVVVAYVFQLMAVDHWHVDPADVTGVEGSARHIAHCHGNASGCSEGASGLSGTFAEAALTPLPPNLTPLDAPHDTASMVEAFLPTPNRPPQSS